ncbi:MAG: hypothetical protein QXW00_03210 [Candidatus Woesearchaeota archaeon]
MDKLIKYVYEIKQNLQQMSTSNLQNIILICRDARMYIHQNLSNPVYAALDQSFLDMEALAENVLAEGQHKPIDPSRSRIEKMKAISNAWENYFQQVKIS